MGRNVMELLANINPLIYIAIMFVMLIIMLLVTVTLNSKVNRMIKKYEKFMKGKNAEDLDDILHQTLDKMDKIELAHHRSMIKIDEGLNSIGSTYKKMGIVKYDAFKEMGGNLSFALAMLNSENNGFIINTMHGRESSYTYIKEIINGEAYSTLGEEEKEALDKALNS